MEAKALAKKLGCSDKRLRAFMRKHNIRPEDQKGSRWDISDGQAKKVTDLWGKRKQVVKAAPATS